MVGAFETELLAILPKLRATAVMFTRDRSSADDLVQDSLVLALTAQARYTPGTNLSAWMYRLMRNRFISLMRMRRPPSLSLDDPEAMAVGMFGDQEPHIARLELECELAKLPAHQREAVLLVGGAGLSYEEAGDVLGCTVGTVKSRVSRGRETLRSRLMGSPDDGAALPTPDIEIEDDRPTSGRKSVRALHGGKAMCRVEKTVAQNRSL